MSAFAYGRIVQQQATAATPRILTGTDKLILAVAALIPTEVIAGHAYLLGRLTTTDAAGTTTVTDAPALRVAMVVLLALSFLPFVVGRGTKDWKGSDWVRFLLPPAAFLAWTMLIGTSALTPWVAGRVPADALAIVGVLLGFVLIFVKRYVTP